MKVYEADTIAAAAMIGVAPHVIRNWAARGHLAPLRTEGTRTIYDAEAVVKVAARFGYITGLRPQDSQDDAGEEECCAPDCENPALDWTDLPLPLCRKHAMAVWLRVHEEWTGRLKARMAATPAPDPAQPVVYFIRSGDLVKIGTTICLPARLDALSTHGPGAPEVLLVVAGDRTEERRVHALFADDRVRGEWFRPSGRLMQFIQDRLDRDIRSVHGRLVAL